METFPHVFSGCFWGAESPPAVCSAWSLLSSEAVFPPVTFGLRLYWVTAAALWGQHSGVCPSPGHKLRSGFFFFSSEQEAPIFEICDTWLKYPLRKIGQSFPEWVQAGRVVMFSRLIMRKEVGIEKTALTWRLQRWTDLPSWHHLVFVLRRVQV